MDRCGDCGFERADERVCVRCLYLGGGDRPIEIAGVELGEVLGRGGMGVVYRARQVALGRPVAVKVIAPELAESEAFRTRFAREARLMARLDHPGIVAVHDSGEVDGTCYLVMELVEGKPLSRQLPVPVVEAIAIAITIADALAHAHRLGIVHRDIKPSNVLVGDDGRIKLADFGLARAVVPESDGSAVSGCRAGTLPFMAPEAIAGAAPDPRMDLFALAVLLHQVATGTLPGDGGMTQPLRLPGRVEQVVARGLAADPARRYQSAGEMRSALEACLLPAPRPRRRAGIAIAASVALAGAFAIAATAAAGRRPPETAAGDEAKAEARAWANGDAEAGAAVEAEARKDAAAGEAEAPRRKETRNASGNANRNRNGRPDRNGNGNTKESARRRGEASRVAGREATPRQEVAPALVSLVVRAQPWARVSIDGQPAGLAEPPSASFVVRPGDRELWFSNPATGRNARRRIHVAPGRPASVSIDLRSTP